MTSGLNFFFAVFSTIIDVSFFDLSDGAVSNTLSSTFKNTFRTIAFPKKKTIQQFWQSQHKRLFSSNWGDHVSNNLLYITDVILNLYVLITTFLKLLESTPVSVIFKNMPENPQVLEIYLFFFGMHVDPARLTKTKTISIHSFLFILNRT